MRTLLALLALLVSLEPAAAQAVFTVNTTSDANTRDDDLSLREAISVLNGNVLTRSELTAAEQARITGTLTDTPAEGQNRIEFDLPGTAPYQIALGSSFPAVSRPVFIDGLSQPGSGCASGPEGVTVEVRGTFSATTFDLRGGGHRLRGLALTRGGRTVQFITGTVASEITCTLFGYAPDGTRDRSQTADLVVNSAQNVVVGGTRARDRNVFARGLYLDEARGAIVQGNYVGTRPDGTSEPGYEGGVRIFTGDDRRAGILVVSDDEGGGVLVGGARAGAACTGPCNVIVAAPQGVVSYVNRGPEERIQGNYIGVDVDGVVRATVGVGVVLDFSHDVLVGGPGAGEGNRIEGARGDGVQIMRPALSNRVIGNTIRGNGGVGIRGPSTSTSLTDYLLSANAIDANGELGIDIGSPGVSSIDAGDGDPGQPNRPELSRYPTLVSGGRARVVGGLSSLPDSDFRIEAFASPACDALRFGEGAAFLGGFDVTTDAGGSVAFSEVLTVPAGVPDGWSVTLTATGPEGTSEFSRCAPPPPANEYVVTTTADAGPGSLRQAIIDANDSRGEDPADRITFSIPATDAGCDGNGVCTIQPVSELPAISEGVFIDGLTQPGASCESWPATLKVVLNGEQAGVAYGLQLRSSGSTVQGLVINGFNTNSEYSGIRILFNPGVAAADRNRIYCNYIGTDVTGSRRVPNGAGVQVNGNDNVIGGPEPGQRNLISGNSAHNVEMSAQNSGGDRNVIQGNFIGPDATGTRRLPATEAFHFEDGVQLFNNFSDAVDNVIGGTDHTPWTCDRACNLIAGNGGDQVDVAGPIGTVVQGNFIGTDLTGTRALTQENGLESGVSAFSAPAMLVGGTEPGAGNLISGLGGSGIDLTDTRGGTFISGRSADTVIRGNRIGTDASGTQPLGNNEGGVWLRNSLRPVSDVQIGGTDPGAGNLIAFNDLGGVVVSGEGLFGNSILGNSIHSNRRGTEIFGDAHVTDGLGIDLAADGITANDPLDADGGPHGRINYPVLTPIVTRTGAGGATVEGLYEGAPGASFRLEFFASAQCSPTRFGEGERFLGHLDVRTNANGRARFSGSFTAPSVPAGWVVTATATDEQGSTSEFSQCAEFPAGALTVTSAEDAGPGTLRDAILVAKGMPGAQTIAFSVPGGVARIALDSGLPLVNGPTVFDGLSQAGSACGPDALRLRVALDGRTRVPNGLVFVEGAEGSAVRGLAIGRTTRTGLSARLPLATPLQGLTLTCNRLGISPSGQPWPIEDPQFSSVSTYGAFVSASYAQIGRAGEGNEVGHADWGLYLVIDSSAVQGNYVGTDRDSADRGAGTGIWLYEGSEDNTVGGTRPGEGNTVAFNTHDGIQVRDITDNAFGSRTDGNRILGNSVHDNGGLGINLCEASQRFINQVCDEATPNDDGDGDDGPNRWQNYPEIASAGVVSSRSLQVVYRVPSDPANAAYPLRVEFFLADADGEEGAVFLGADTYTEADFSGGPDKTIGLATAVDVSEGLRVLATATDADGNTSEFTGTATAVPAERDPALPAVFALEPVWPNPVGGERATVRFGLPVSAAARVEVFDALGRRVGVLAAEERAAGWHEVSLGAGSLASGVYLVRMTAGEGEGRFEAVRRVTVVR